MSGGFSACYQGNTEVCFDSLSFSSERTAALPQHFQPTCLTLLGLKDRIVPWCMSKSNFRFWSCRESLSAFLSLDTPFQWVGKFRHLLKSHLFDKVCVGAIWEHTFPISVIAKWHGSWGAVHVHGAMLLHFHVLKMSYLLLAKDICGLPWQRVIHFACFFQRNSWIQTHWDTRGSWSWGLLHPGKCTSDQVVWWEKHCLWLSSYSLIDIFSMFIFN